MGLESSLIKQNSLVQTPYSSLKVAHKLSHLPQTPKWKGVGVYGEFTISIVVSVYIKIIQKVNYYFFYCQKYP